MSYSAKRLLDVGLPLLAAPVLVPVGIGVAFLVRWQLGTPVLFRQRRPGLRGQPFTMLKFRTMQDVRGPDGTLLPDEARLTSFGRWLRATSLDELPSLLNVLRGEMSLVGPRPLLLQYLDRYTPTQARRHEVRPGLTGWAQVNGRNTTPWDERLAQDVWYVDRVSLWLDLKILLMTVRRVWKRNGISATGHATMPEFRGGDGS